MGLFDVFKSKKEAAPEQALVKTETAEAKPDIHQLIEEFKEKTAMPAYRITTEVKKTGLFDSKFAGVPYWDMSQDYPKDSDGNNMFFLAQINFGKENFGDERLPDSGLLQFFISTDDLMGLDFDNMGEQTGYRVVYHETVDEGVTEEDVLSLGLPDNEEDELYMPISSELAISFEKFTDNMGTCDHRYEKVAAEVFPVLSDDEEETVYDEIFSNGSKVLGYPVFTQEDPREDMTEEEAEYYDCLLLQIDSETDMDNIMWGDGGVANFFISREALKKKDFSKVLYNWDCF